MEEQKTNNQIPTPEPTTALEDILAFFKLLPTRIRAVFNTIRAKLVVITKRLKPTRQSPVVIPDRDLESTSSTSKAEAIDEAITPCPTCHQTLTERHCEEAKADAAISDEPTFAPITRKNFYKHPIFWARFLGYAIPLSFLLYVLYINYLPFGYHKTFTINVGSANDTTPGEFYLEPSKGLSERMTNPDGSTYRTLNGMATAVFKPNVVLKDAKITVEVKGDEGVSLIPPTIDFDPNSIKWDYNWDFTNGVPKDFINIKDRAFSYDSGIYFDGTARLELPKSANLFEDGPFSVYVEWVPNNDTGDGQQIIGHYNWELWQNKNSITYQIGRTNSATGETYSIKYPIVESFFNTKHTAIAIYSPEEDGYGYIKLIIDGALVGIVDIKQDKIFQDYNGDKNLSIGWTSHNYGKNPYFTGQILNAKITPFDIFPRHNKAEYLNTKKFDKTFFVILGKSKQLTNIKLNVTTKLP